jgi:hypothetical protein
MRCAGQARLIGHLRHAKCPRQAAEITDIRLRHIDRAHLDHAPPDGQVAILLAAGHIELQRVGHLFRLLQFPVGAGFLEMADAVVLQQLPDLDGTRRRVTAVRVHEKVRIVAQRLVHCGNDRLGAAGPFVDIVAAFAGHAELEGVVPKLVAQTRQPRRLVLGGNVALHARRVDPDRARLAAD